MKNLGTKRLNQFVLRPLKPEFAPRRHLLALSVVKLILAVAHAEEVEA
jgi:hypothetical protein